MPEVHPTAIIDPAARLGEGCAVGPYCVIGAGVELGGGCVLHHHVSLTGPAKIGAGNTFFPYAAVGGRSQDLKYEGEPTHLEIGDGNTFREFVTVNRGTLPGTVTRIGSGGNFLAYSHIAHDCEVGDGVIFSNNGTLAGHVQVGPGAILGGLTAVHQFCRIGRLAITGGCSKIVQDVPPFCIADGNPGACRGVNVVGLKRAGWGEAQIREAKEAYKILYRRGLNKPDAVAALRAEFPKGGAAEEMADFAERSERGLA